MEINEDVLQYYLIRMAPDFSVFQLVEKYYYDNDITTEYFKDILSYKANAGPNYTSDFYRAMFQIYVDDNAAITVSDLNSDEYVTINYRKGIKILITAKETPIVINSNKHMDLIIGVAF